MTSHAATDTSATDTSATDTSATDTSADVDQLVGRLLGTVELAEATRLARRGRYAEAERLLSASRETPAGLDLRARIAAQEGRLDDAGRLWRAAADRRGDPGAYAPELAALRRWRSRRHGRARPAVAGLVVAAGAAGATGWLAAGGWPRESSVTSAEVRSARDETLTALEHQSEESREAQAALTAQVEQLDRDVQRMAPPAFGGLEHLRSRLGAVPGVDVTEAAGSLQVRFGEPVFTEATVVSPAGSGTLAAVADAMTAMSAGGDRYLTVVTGHTDGIPLPAGSRFGDNEGLARERARTAVAILVTAGLPAEAVSVDVAPSPPPFPSDQRRNRSVTLTVYEAGE